MQRLIDEQKNERFEVWKGDDMIALLRISVNPGPQSKGPRPIGLAQGMGSIHPNCFNRLPDDLLALFNKDSQ